MPSEKLENGTLLTLQNFTKMDVDLPPNNSQVELVGHESGITADGSPGGGEAAEATSLRNITMRQWLEVAILCYVNLINYMDRYTLAGVLPKVQDYFKIDDDMGGLLQTAFVLSYMLFAPLFGYLGDRYSRRWIMAGGVFVWSLTTLLGSFMDNYILFLLFRGLVGIGEASYSTLAPTILSDLFFSDVRSKMLAIFYFAIPVGSGLGYIVGSKTAEAVGSWEWSLRVTPALGLIAVVLLIFVLRDPERGQSEGSGHMEPTPWKDDLKDIIQNKSFMFSTAGFTCVAFVTGALAWWGPKFIQMGIELHGGDPSVKDSVPLKFGIIAMLSGIIGVPAGSLLAQRLRSRYERIDGYICAGGLLLSSPLVFLACVCAKYNANGCFALVFFAEVLINLSWSIVADILLYVVVPIRRSTAEGFQLLVSHALGDAGSPYLIGVLSKAFRDPISKSESSHKMVEFKSLQYALFTTCIVEVIGGLFFLLTASYLVQDKRKVDKAIQEGRESQDFSS